MERLEGIGAVELLEGRAKSFLGMWCMQWERDFRFGSSMTLGVILIL